ncbi:hypothetical protein [Microbacterium sp.]|uniref:hypothetical protein n=1 Tax=Microbacterium sp. TaxID=51671 RepID=UPI003A8717E4
MTDPARPTPQNLTLWQDLTSNQGGPTRIGVRPVRLGDLVDSYPAGAHDQELFVEGRPPAAAVADFTASVLARDERCRRIVLPVSEQDLDAIAWAEDAGFRYVVDVDTRAGAFSLLVTEPDWVRDQPQILDEIPLKE